MSDGREPLAAWPVPTAPDGLARPRRAPSRARSANISSGDLAGDAQVVVAGDAAVGAADRGARGSARGRRRSPRGRPRHHHVAAPASRAARSVGVEGLAIAVDVAQDRDRRRGGPSREAGWSGATIVRVRRRRQRGPADGSRGTSRGGPPRSRRWPSSGAGGIVALLRWKLWSAGVPDVDAAPLTDWFDPAELARNRDYRRGVWTMAVDRRPARRRPRRSASPCSAVALAAGWWCARRGRGPGGRARSSARASRSATFARRAAAVGRALRLGARLRDRHPARPRMGCSTSPRGSACRW